jgi:hypothetical protein
VILVVALVTACSGSNGGGSSPTAPTAATPTATTPAGCSGAAIPQVAVGFNGGSTGVSVTFQLYGETFNQQIGANQNFVITRSVVPCNYELVGQMLSLGNMGVSFALTPPFLSRAAGVEKGSVVIDEGPEGVFGPDNVACSVRFNAPNGTPTGPPYNFKIRFKVATSNAVDDRGGGCGLPATGTPAPVPTPTPTGTLSGTWSGTVIATIGNGNPRAPLNLSVVLQHSSTRLTGTFSSYPATLDLFPGQVSGAITNFTGNLTIVSGSTAVMPGSMQVNTGDNTMTGTFSGTNTDGLPERNVFSLRKQ